MVGPFSNQYFGSPMVCEVKDKSDDKFSSHCWKQGTSLIDNLDIVKNAPCLPDDKYPFEQVRIRIITLYKSTCLLLFSINSIKL